MADPLATRSYYSIIVSTGVKANLNDLLIAAYAALSPAQTVPPLTGAQVNLYAKIGNTKTILIGDASLSTTNYGRVLPASTATFNSVATYGPFNNVNVPIGDMYIMADDGSTSVSLGIEILRG